MHQDSVKVYDTHSLVYLHGIPRNEAAIAKANPAIVRSSRLVLEYKDLYRIYCYNLQAIVLEDVYQGQQAQPIVCIHAPIAIMSTHDLISWAIAKQLPYTITEHEKATGTKETPLWFSLCDTKGNTIVQQYQGIIVCLCHQQDVLDLLQSAPRTDLDMMLNLLHPNYPCILSQHVSLARPTEDKSQTNQLTTQDQTSN